MQSDDEDQLLRSVALQNANSILLARRRAEEELIRAKEALEGKTRELADSLAMMRATLESTWDGILVTDARGLVTDFNERYVEMWRIPRDLMASLEHDPIREYTATQLADPAAFRARIAEIDGASATDSFDILELADGRAFERFSRVQVVDGRTVGRVWSFRDITESRRDQDALRDETRRLELLNQTGAVLSSTLDLPTLLQAVTDAATLLSGARFGAFYYSAAEDAGGAHALHTLSGVSHQEAERLGLPRATPLFGVSSRGEGIVRCDDVRARRGDGPAAPHRDVLEGRLGVRSYLAVPVVSRSGEVIGGLLFGHPEPGVFSERAERLVGGVAAQAAVAIDNARLYEAAQRAAEERRQLLDSERFARGEAERASSMKDEFLAMLSHELRTPLNAILGWAHMLRIKSLGPAELQGGLEVIERNARIQTQLIEDLLDMSRITSGKLSLDVQIIQPAAFIEAALETVRPAAEAKAIALDAALDPGAGPIAGDPNRLQQVVWNLLSNAIKFTGKGGRVQVRLARTGSRVEIAVSDTGIGITREFLEQVFDRFRQADASRTRAAAGLGLGLSIVKHLVEMHAGTVRAESAGEGLGATFVVELPIALAPPGHGPGPHPAGAAVTSEFKRSDLAGIKVLVVEDQADARELIRRVLEECDARVLTASTAAEAVAAIQSERPHVLVSDIGMPDVDGYELLRRVRALGPELGGLPAIALTAFARSEDRTRTLRAGFLVHVSKPVEPSELVAAVAGAAGRAGHSATD